MLLDKTVKMLPKSSSKMILGYRQSSKALMTLTLSSFTFLWSYTLILNCLYSLISESRRRFPLWEHLHLERFQFSWCSSILFWMLSFFHLDSRSVQAILIPVRTKEGPSKQNKIVNRLGLLFWLFSYSILSAYYLTRSLIVAVAQGNSLCICYIFFCSFFTYIYFLWTIFLGIAFEAFTVLAKKHQSPAH